jgi:hypothetical protein
VWLWWVIDHLSDTYFVLVWWSDAGNFKVLQKLLVPLNIVTCYVDGDWVYVNNIVAEWLIVGKKNT